MRSWPRRRRCCSRRAALQFRLQTLHLLLKLLIAVLQLLDIAGEVADRGLKVIDAHHQICRRVLGPDRCGPKRVEKTATKTTEKRIIAGNNFGK